MPIDLGKEPFPHAGKNNSPKGIGGFDCDEKNCDADKINIHEIHLVWVDDFNVFRADEQLFPGLFLTLSDFYLTIATIALLREFF